MLVLVTVWLLPLLCAAQVPPGPPTAPPPPRFMQMNGLPLGCFDKANFIEERIEVFVCNGGGGVAGLRRLDDKSKVVYVRDADIALNLNMQQARKVCVGKRFAVAWANDTYSFRCGETEVTATRFQAAPRAPWKQYNEYLSH